MAFYHIDRTKKLKPGRLDLYIDTVGFDGISLEYCNNLFPQGLSHLGMIYTAPHQADTLDYFSCIVETIFEYVRIIEFPYRPSRYQSFFLCDSLEAIYQWIAHLNAEDFLIYEVKPETTFLADASFRDLAIDYLNQTKSFAPALVYVQARKYWQGIISADPRIEFVAPLPVEIFRLIEISPLSFRSHGDGLHE